MATMDIAKTNTLSGEGFSELAMALKQPESIDYVNSDGELVLNAQPKTVMVTAETDLANLPDIYEPGSIAFTADETGKWRLDASGEWQSLVAAANEGNEEDQI